MLVHSSPDIRIYSNIRSKLVSNIRIWIWYSNPTKIKEIGTQCLWYQIKVFLNQTTVLNKSFATLHICLIFGSLSYANNFKVNIGKNTDNLHKQSNIFGKNMLIRYCFIAKTIHPGCITKSAQNQHIHKYESNNTLYLFDHTVVFV